MRTQTNQNANPDNPDITGKLEEELKLLRALVKEKDVLLSQRDKESKEMAQKLKRVSRQKSNLQKANSRSCIMLDKLQKQRQVCSDLNNSSSPSSPNIITFNIYIYIYLLCLVLDMRRFRPLKK